MLSVLVMLMNDEDILYWHVASARTPHNSDFAIIEYENWWLRIDPREDLDAVRPAEFCGKQRPLIQGRVKASTCNNEVTIRRHFWMSETSRYLKIDGALVPIFTHNFTTSDDRLVLSFEITSLVIIRCPKMRGICRLRGTLPFSATFGFLFL